VVDQMGEEANASRSQIVTVRSIARVKYKQDHEHYL